MKKAIHLILCACAATTMLSACSSSTPAPTTAPPASQAEEGAATDAPSDKQKIIVALAADQGGINDKAINEGTYNGLKRAEQELGIELKVIESKSGDDYEPTLNTFVSANAQLIVGVGSQMPDAIRIVAERNPDIHFVSMDAVADAPNVKSFVFKEQEGSFLAGIVAGLTTKTNKIGFIGGKDISVINRFEAGFAAGVMCVNPEAAKGLTGTGGASGTTVKYVDSFSDSNKAYELAKSLYSDGCDIVYHAAGGAGIGLFQAGKELVEAGENVWVIGVDQDQAEVLPEYSSFILTSMVKRTDEVVFNVVNEELAGKFEGGTFSVGLAEDAVGLAASSSRNTPQDVLDKAQVAAAMVKEGKITIPADREELAGFSPVNIE